MALCCRVKAIDNVEEVVQFSSGSKFISCLVSLNTEQLFDINENMLLGIPTSDLAFLIQTIDLGLRRLR